MKAMEGSFAAILKGFRADAGLSQQTLATNAGLSIGTIRALEQGAYDPTWQSVQKLAAALGKDCTAFVTVNPLAENETKPAAKKPVKGKK